MAANTKSYVIPDKADDIRKFTGWECPVHRVSVEALWHLHEVYLEQMRRQTGEAASPSRPLEKREIGEKGKDKVPAFRLASDIEQRTDLWKVSEERS